jgi:ParB family chromosome partitioning protein
MVLAKPLTVLPKMGDQIPVEAFHISRLNVRYGEPFGDSEEDKILISNLSQGRIIQPFKCRPEGAGYGVIFGGRRFQAKKEAGAKYFVVGVDCLIEEMSDQEAREASLVENLFRRDVDPIARAKALNNVIKERGESLRSTALRWGVPVSNLSEWLKVLELTPSMQDALAKGEIDFTNGLKVARMNFDIETQDKLSEVLQTQGPQAFEKELENLKEATEPTRKRGRPKGVSTNKLAKGNLEQGKVYWPKLRESLKDFADIFSEYCTMREWEDPHNYHLRLEVTMPKDLSDDDSEDNDSDLSEPGELERLSSDESPQVCGSCGTDILEGEEFSEQDGFFYCGPCSRKTIKVES